MSGQQLFLEPSLRSIRQTRPATHPANGAEPQRGAGPASDTEDFAPRRATYAAVKPALEYLAAVTLFVLALPIIAVAAAVTKMTSPGPAFFRQTRVGKDGREFQVWKIRTMVMNAEALTGPVWSVSDDPRVTSVGRFLRASHIDEFPQLLNVLAGHMSLIGPRPERPEFVAHLDWQIPHYGQRLRVRPGITGLAQMLLPPDSDLESVRSKLICDLYYIRNLSPWLDLKILGHTLFVLIRAVAFAAARPFRLPSRDAISAALGVTGDAN